MCLDCGCNKNIQEIRIDVRYEKPLINQPLSIRVKIINETIITA